MPFTQSSHNEPHASIEMLLVGCEPFNRWSECHWFVVSLFFYCSKTSTIMFSNEKKIELNSPKNSVSFTPKAINWSPLSRRFWCLVHIQALLILCRPMNLKPIQSIQCVYPFNVPARLPAVHLAPPPLPPRLRSRSLIRRVGLQLIIA